MTNKDIRFATDFVDSVTIRPFFEDLRRSKQLSMMLARIPRIASARQSAPSTPIATNEAA